MMFENNFVQLDICVSKFTVSTIGLCIIGPRALELLNVVVINIWYGSLRVGAG